mgnify:FL=1
MSYLRNELYIPGTWNQAGSSVYYSLGNVGIGTVSPAYAIDVVGDINFTGTFRQNGTPYIGSQWTTSGTAIYYTTGNVGIGTATNLTNALNVNGTVSATSFSGAGTGLTGTAASLTAGSATTAGTAGGLTGNPAISVTTVNSSYPIKRWIISSASYATKTYFLVASQTNNAEIGRAHV